MIVRIPKRMRGMGAALSYADQCGQSMNWFEKAVLAPYCAPAWISQGVASVVENRSAYQPLPIAPAPGVTLSSSPAAASAPGAVLAGNDAQGNPVYAVPETPGENMARFSDSVAQYFDEQGNLTPADTSFFAKYQTAIIVGLSVLGGLVFVNASGGRRR